MMASLFEKIFRPKEAEKSKNALKEEESFLQLRGYRPVFHDWKG